MKTNLLLICVILVFTGCATTKPKERGASLAARTSLTAARSSIITAKGRAGDVKREIQTARVEIEKPDGDRAKAILAIRMAEKANDALAVDLDTAQGRAEVADGQVDQLAQDNAHVAAALAESERQTEKALKSAHRWRLIAAGLGVAVLGFLAIKFGPMALAAFA